MPPSEAARAHEARAHAALRVAVTVAELVALDGDWLWPVVEHVEDVDFAVEFGLPLPAPTRTVAELLGVHR